MMTVLFVILMFIALIIECAITVKISDWLDNRYEKRIRRIEKIIDKLENKD